MDNYHEKYLKYKSKYLKLKYSQKGGHDIDDNLNDNTIDNIDNKDAVDMLHFWGNQFIEHCFILYSMIIDINLQDDAHYLYKKWSEYIGNIFPSSGIDIYKIVLDESDFSNIDMDNINFDEVYNMIEELKDYQEILKQLIVDEGKWIGWIYPTYIKHILDELNHFIREFNDEISDEDKMIFWNKCNAENAALISHMLDPTLENDVDIDKFNDYYHKVMSKLHVTQKEQMIIMSVNYVKEFDDMVSNLQNKIHDKKIRSMIYPMMIDHIYRENKRCMYVLNKVDKLNVSLIK